MFSDFPGSRLCQMKEAASVLWGGLLFPPVPVALSVEITEFPHAVMILPYTIKHQAFADDDREIRRTLPKLVAGNP
jgi:hypothetical protein